MFIKLLAKFLALPIVANWIIEQALKTPYSPIVKNERIYMERFWLFNSYDQGPQKQEKSKYPWFPWNIRVHHIRLPDQDRHLHDHPWNARTFILKGGYTEQRQHITASDENSVIIHYRLKKIVRHVGDTAKLNYGEYHRIIELHPGGAWTLFVSGPYQGFWGFLVDGVKVHWRTYLGLDK